MNTSLVNIEFPLDNDEQDDPWFTIPSGEFQCSFSPLLDAPVSRPHRRAPGEYRPTQSRRSTPTNDIDGALSHRRDALLEFQSLPANEPNEATLVERHENDRCTSLLPDRQQDDDSRRRRSRSISNLHARGMSTFARSISLLIFPLASRCNPKTFPASIGRSRSTTVRGSTTADAVSWDTSTITLNAAAPI